MLKQKFIKMAKAKKTTSNEINKKGFELTIDKSLFDSWQKYRRTSDVEELMELTGKSAPIIYRALQFGHVKNDNLCDTISAFYIARVEKQKEQAEKINS
mgnify:CR=1 FL=1